MIFAWSLAGLAPIGVNLTKNRPIVRRGEGGGAARGGPLMDAVWGTVWPVGGTASLPDTF